MADYATQWFDGEGLPTNDIGLAGDYFLNTSNADIYKKISNTWQRIGNIRGAQGEKGLQGEKGEKGLKGDRGDKGLTGDVGPQGSIGLSGSIWYDGIGVPEVSLGVVNDFYLNIFNGDIYKKKAKNYWERVSSFLPDLTYFLEKIDKMLADGYAKIEEIDSTFIANMENMAKTFNMSIEDMKNEFNTNINSFTSVFYENLARQNNEFNTLVSNSNKTIADKMNEVDKYITDKDADLEERFREIADVSAQNEILEARTSIDGTKHSYLKDRLLHDFNNLNIDVDCDTLINQIEDIDDSLKE